MRIMENGVVREMTAEEEAEFLKQAKISAAIENRRPMTESEVSRMLITAQINTLAVDDNAAIRMREFYPEWATGTAYSQGYKVQYNGKLWRVVQAHTAQAGWEPENAASLWEQINETYAGTPEDPIPYTGNMTLCRGFYYLQEGTVYLCIRDTGEPVHQPLAALAGLYTQPI